MTTERPVDGSDIKRVVSAHDSKADAAEILVSMLCVFENGELSLSNLVKRPLQYIYNKYGEGRVDYQSLEADAVSNLAQKMISVGFESGKASGYYEARVRAFSKYAAYEALKFFSGKKQFKSLDSVGELPSQKEIEYQMAGFRNYELLEICKQKLDAVQQHIWELVNSGMSYAATGREIGRPRNSVQRSTNRIAAKLEVCLEGLKGDEGNNGR